MTRADFERLKALTIETKGLDERLRYLYDKATHTTAVLNGLPRNATLRSKLEEVIVRIQTELTEHERKMQELCDLRATFERELATLPSTERSVLKYRYVEGQSFKTIGHLMHLSIGYTFQLHRRALKFFLRECS